MSLRLDMSCFANFICLNRGAIFNNVFVTLQLAHKEDIHTSLNAVGVSLIFRHCILSFRKTGH
jgi:hypothetical protein